MSPNGCRQGRVSPGCLSWLLGPACLSQNVEAAMHTLTKHGPVFYGIVLSAIHFAGAIFLRHLPTLMLRPEDMVGSGEQKPYWPASRLRDAVQGAGDILSMPASRLCDSWPGMPDGVALALFVANSCLWGFALALLLRLVLARLHLSHEPKTASPHGSR
jgi:hypothetical protein